MLDKIEYIIPSAEGRTGKPPSTSGVKPQQAATRSASERTPTNAVNTFFFIAFNLVG